MSLIEMGRWLRSSGHSGPEFQCRRCGTAHDVQYHVCPCCSGFSVDAIEDVRRSHGPVG